MWGGIVKYFEKRFETRVSYNLPPKNILLSTTMKYLI